MNGEISASVESLWIGLGINILWVGIAWGSLTMSLKGVAVSLEEVRRLLGLTNGSSVFVRREELEALKERIEALEEQ